MVQGFGSVGKQDEQLTTALDGSVAAKGRLERTVAANYKDVMLPDPWTYQGTSRFSQQWASYYPGMLLWKSAVRDHAKSWLYYHGLPVVFQQAILNHIVESIQRTTTNEPPPDFVRRNSLGGWESLSLAEVEKATKEAIMEYWTKPIESQRWGPPTLEGGESPCAPPRDHQSIICQMSSARTVLEGFILPHIACLRVKNVLLGEKLLKQKPCQVSLPSYNKEVNPIIATNEDLTINDKIEARYKGGNHWVGGKVALLINVEGTAYFDIQYNNWIYEKMVPGSYVRPKKMNANKRKETRKWYGVPTAAPSKCDAFCGRQLPPKLAPYQ